MKSVRASIVGLPTLFFFGVGAMVPIDASAQTLTTLHSFFVSPGDGAEPTDSLIADASGNLYGTTSGGGIGNGYGTVFKVTPMGTETVLHQFNPEEDGAFPEAGLIADAAGNLYGTTKAGGPKYGTVFRLTPNSDGTYVYTVLHSFTGYPTDGASPDGLIADAAGNLYGTTTGGGASACGDFGCGTVFKLTRNSDGTYTESVLHSFTGIDGWYGGSDGQYPFSGLIADRAGNFYGTTFYGGGSGCLGYGCGTVFKLTTNLDGTYNESVVYSFSGDRDGAAPTAGLLADAAGNLLGTTTQGGAGRACQFGCGTVFELSAHVDGTYSESVLYRFGGESDGETPYGGLIVDAAGILYGTTSAGGDYCAFGCGTVFALSPAGTLTVLHNFNGTDGGRPTAALMADAAGNLYGTTSQGGSSDGGTVFKQTVPATFTGVPGAANCSGQTLSFLAREFGGMAHAATALGFASVTDLQNAVTVHCGGQQ